MIITARHWLLVLLIAIAPAALSAEDKVNFRRDIKPIFSNHCFTCHGPDAGQRKADLRLDVREVAVEAAIEVGDADGSDLIARVTSNNPKEHMPPPKSNKPRLNARQIELLKRWIDEGATYDLHWSFVKPERPKPAQVKQTDWAKTPIDQFVAAVQEAHNFKASPAADRRTLIRRLYFDLIGLPPTAAEVATFENDKSPNAYEKVVDRLLASKHYGERMAVYWLDMVRYADTNGIHGDNHRDHAPFRDYVIRAFNDNMPFDKFTVEQLAGDLLPNATVFQKVASGYNRLNMTTREGGAQAKEYMAKYSADRVRNASGVWMGMTLGCSECHDHKFDPFTSKDFYSFAAFFADVKETAVGTQGNAIKVPLADQAEKLLAMEKQIAEAQKHYDGEVAKVAAKQSEWESQLTARIKAGDTNGIAPELVQLLSVPAESRNDDQKNKVAEHHRNLTPELKTLREKLAVLQNQKKGVANTGANVLISIAGAPRTMRILPRGNWLDESGEEVQPATPGFMFGLDVKDRRQNRLDLANWFVARDNPLTSRVMVNRLWKICFGEGIVTSLDDFGSQGAFPTHPELLDWLAIELMDSKWDIKHIVKLIVMSSAYQQSSRVSADARERDPANQWLARQHRFRLDAEMVRDNALSVSGLLVKKIGGTSAKPYQPAGYWRHLNFPQRTYKHDGGENQYRRGLYTYWCRTFLHPSLSAFDAPTREECSVARPRSNTPLQALVLLNDPTYVEAARVFAGRMIREGGASPKDRLAFAFRQVLSRKPRALEEKILLGLFEKHLAQYKAEAGAANQIGQVGQSKATEGIDAIELAAWTSVSRAILNLHETISRY